MELDKVHVSLGGLYSEADGGRESRSRWRAASIRAAESSPVADGD
jgi:hypothetical protein